jgi:hypothetical protein
MKPTLTRRISGPLASAVCLVSSGGLASGQTLLPIISKVQVQYSMVGHYSHIPSRVDFYNSQGSPLGNTNYVVPHLVYEPFVTLYNPYNTTLTMTRSRVMISNPPVGFRFKKNGDYLRNEFAAGEFLGLARFQIANENNPNATKTLTLVLGGGTPSSYAGQIVLQPGQTKTFSARLETNWTWGLETAGVFTPRCFYDWNVALDFTNKDNRTQNLYGMEAIVGTDFRAGFQTDQLSVASNRPAATKYPFEASIAGGWVAIKTTDTVRVEAKGIDTNAGTPDFQLSLLRGVNTNAAADVAKTFNFSISSLTQVGTGGPTVPAITRTFRAGDILQFPNETTPGGKSPFAIFTIVAKSTALQQQKFLATPQPAADQLYEARLDEIVDFTDSLNFIGPSDAPLSGVVMTQMQRSGDLFTIDVAARSPIYPGLPSGLKVRGTSDLASGFTDDLTAVSTIMEGPAYSGVYKVTVNVAGRGPRYFVRIEK